mgnify:CR=1 FL=1
MSGSPARSITRRSRAGGRTRGRHGPGSTVGGGGAGTGGLVRPSTMLEELKSPTSGVAASLAGQPPEIIELLNIADYTNQVRAVRFVAAAVLRHVTD